MRTGFGCHVINRNRSGTVPVTLMQSSATNSALSQLANLDEVTGDVSYPLTVRDIRSDATLCVAHASKIKKMPASAFGKELGTRVGVYQHQDRHLRRRQPAGGELAMAMANNETLLQRKKLKVRDVEVAIVMIPTLPAAVLLKIFDSCPAPRAARQAGTSSLDANVATIGPDLGAALAGIESSKLDALWRACSPSRRPRSMGLGPPRRGRRRVRGSRDGPLQVPGEAVRLNYPDF